ncbi:hypothetical protein IHQ68_08630 [Chelatococcus sambhunathii]|uniref:Uncharacterized protein n=1 Tax=Chelatococcus sambhunathii TaxID=363953 RepID=A0ABU1DF54_9HYPH|nr:hypothetical protein [Chelatococcus sambhunathii]MDR4306681.1 hypothetical protein [Chelatococcus sambhunathii]
MSEAEDALKSGPKIEFAADVVRRLLAEASELDWSGDHARADRLRREARAIEARGETWVVNF